MKSYKLGIPLGLFWVTFNRKPQEYQTRFDLTAEDYDKLSTPRHVGTLKEVKGKWKEIQRRSEEVAFGLDPFTFEGFDKDYILDIPYSTSARI